MAVSNVASSTTSATALALGNDRKAVFVANSDANDAYVLVGPGTASASNMSLVVAAKGNALIPTAFANCELNVVWAADGSGYLHVTTK